MRERYRLLSALGAALLLAACARHSSRSDSPLAPDASEVLTVPDAPLSPNEPLAPLPPLPAMTLDQIGPAYVKLVLALGELDPNYVDAYYGPPAWRDEARKTLKPARLIDAEAQQLLVALAHPKPDPTPVDPALNKLRLGYLRNQLGSLSARARMNMGLKLRFDDEARALYDVSPPHYHESDFKPALDRLDKLLPKGAGTLADRYNRYVDRFAIPKDRIETVMRAAIGEARKRTQAHLQLPANERFELALVTGKPWSAYNWYQGNGVSRIEVNTELPVGVARAIELASHEGYPGHHVYNGLLESALVRTLGWPEYEVYPLFSPQSLIAEGSADFGVGLAFPGDEKLKLTKQLFKLAGFDPKDAKKYLSVVAEARALAPATIEAARNYREGRANAAQTAGWLQQWTLASPERAAQRVKFFDTYGAYIVNYTYGEELVRGYVEHRGDHTPGSPTQWEAFRALLTTPRVPTDLVADAEVPTIGLSPPAPPSPAPTAAPQPAPQPIAPVVVIPPTVAAPLPAPAPIAAPPPAKTYPPVQVVPPALHLTEKPLTLAPANSAPARPPLPSPTPPSPVAPSLPPPSPSVAAPPSAASPLTPMQTPAPATASDQQMVFQAPPLLSARSDGVVHGKVVDLVAFEGFMLTKPTPAQFREHYPDVKLMLPGQISSKEFRLDHSRYFAQLDAQGRIVSGKFM